jgi:hypothetical protein
MQENYMRVRMEPDVTIAQGRSARLAVLLALAGMLVVAQYQTTYAAAVSAGGPWTHTQGGITARYSGGHDRVVTQARAYTVDDNGRNGRLRTRLRYSDGITVYVTDWQTSSANTAALNLFGPPGTQAISSEHQAQHPFNLVWSSVTRPHAF